jgi:hypothetical protein
VRQIGFQVKPGLGAMAWPWVLLVSAGFAVTAAIFVAASRRSNWPLRRLTIVVVTVAGAAAAAQQVQFANAFGPSRGSGGLRAALYLGWTGLGLAGLLLLLAIAWPRAPVLPALAAILFVLPGIAASSAGSTAYRALLSKGVVAVGGVLYAVFSLILYWQAVAGIRVTRDLSLSARRLFQTKPLLLVVALGLNIIWLLAGYLDWLPSFLGGNASGWSASRSDGLLSWALAAAIAGFVYWWLRARPPSPKETGTSFVAAAALVVVGFTAVEALDGLTLLSAAALEPLPRTSWLDSHLFSLSGWLSDHILWSQVITVYIAGLVGIFGFRRRPGTGLYLLVFAAWSLPRAIGITINLLWPGTVGSAGHLELLTLDTALTLLVAVLLIRDIRRGASADGRLFVIVVAVTLVCALPTVLAGVFAGSGFYLLLVLPIWYQFFLDSEHLNEVGLKRPTRVLAAIGLATLVLTVAALRVSASTLSSGSLSDDELVRLLFAVPFAAVLLAEGVGAEPSVERGSQTA